MVEPDAKRYKADVEARLEICMDLLPIMELSLSYYERSSSLHCPFKWPLWAAFGWATIEEAFARYVPRLQEKIDLGICRPSVLPTLDLVLRSFHFIIDFECGGYPQQIHQYCMDTIERFLQKHGKAVSKCDQRRLLRFCIGRGAEMDISRLYELCDSTEQSTFFQCLPPTVELSYFTRISMPELSKKVLSMRPLLKRGDNPAFLPYAFLMDLYGNHPQATIFTEEWEDTYMEVTYPSGTVRSDAILQTMGPSMLNIDIWPHHYFEQMKQENDKFQMTLPFTEQPRRLSLFPLQVLERTERRWRTCYFAIGIQCNYVVMTSLLYHMPWQTLSWNPYTPGKSVYAE